MIFTDVLHHGKIIFKCIYHLMSHPAILDWENEDFHWIHLEHISNRKTFGMLGLGIFILINFLQSTYPTLNLDEIWDISVNISNKIHVGQNYPNPFNPITNIKYKLYKEEFIKATVHDILGNTVNKDLLNTMQTSGDKSLKWNATDNHGRKVPAGVYLYRIEAGDYSKTE